MAKCCLFCGASNRRGFDLPFFWIDKLGKDYDRIICLACLPFLAVEVKVLLLERNNYKSNLTNDEIRLFLDDEWGLNLDD